MAHEHIDLSRDDKTESTWVGMGSPRPGNHENKKWLMSILFCSRDDETKSTWVWEGGVEGARP